MRGMVASVAMVAALAGCSPAAAPGADRQAQLPVTESGATSGGCKGAFASLMDAGGRKKASPSLADATLESCATLAAWKRANHRAGAGNIGSRTMTASLFCADYQRRRGAPPQPICSEAAQASTAPDARERPPRAAQKGKSLLDGLTRRHRPE